jgi:hypothetical protein
MRYVSLIRILATALLSITAFAGCSGAGDGSSVQAASVQAGALGPQAGDSLGEPTPAERRLEWVRRPARSQAAAVDSRLAGDRSSPKTD